VRSAFDLPAEQRTAIQKAVDGTFPGKCDLRFETASDLIGGIELAADGQKVAWSISEYLVSLEDSIADILKTRDRPKPKAPGLQSP
jgi:F-type H+-transporting ATPase subunit b